jgi:DNA-binding NtrC family response regulator
MKDVQFSTEDFRRVNESAESAAGTAGWECTDASGLDAVRVADGDGFGRLVGRSPAMQTLFSQIQRVAPTRASVLIIGASGTGKEVAARTLHDFSPRADQPFIAVNCGAIPETLIEAELFGYERGSFTGAVRSHAGYFERSGEGTVLLDEITEMPLEMQVKLLRVLESRQIFRVGGSKNIEIRCRVLAATNRDPEQAVSDGKLRADLLYRLAVVPISVPPLREREGDAELLAQRFLIELNAEEGSHKRFSEASLQFLHTHTWPGNVRELRNAVQRAFILADGMLELDTAGGRAPVAAVTNEEHSIRVPIGTPLSDVERWLIVATLKRCGGNKTRAAAMLGVSLKTLYNRLNEYRGAGYASSAEAPMPIENRA